MALISCPDCGKSVSDEARVCPFCGLPVVKRLQQMKAEEEARQAALYAEQQRSSDARWAVGTVAVFLILIVAGCISSANQPKEFYRMSAQSSIKAGQDTFQASGKLKLEYACQLNSGKSGSVQLALIDLKTSKPVWSKQVKCVESKDGVPVSDSSETIQVKSSNYDFGSQVTGDATWDMKVTQA
jgi:hypothetical protein